MAKNNKKGKNKILPVLIIIIIIVGVICIIKHKTPKDTEEEIAKGQGLYIHQVIDIDDLDKSLYASEISPTNDFKIASKYKVGQEARTINKSIDMYLDGKMGQALFIREGKTKLNIVQVKYQLKHKDKTTEAMQVDEIMRDFVMTCKSSIGIHDLEKKPESETLNNKKIPFGENIYKGKKLYSATYKVQDGNLTKKEYKKMGMKASEYTKMYDINIYMDGEDTLVCELVRIIA